MKTLDSLEKAPGLVPVKELDAKTATTEEKLEAGWRYVTIPDKDPYDYVFKGIYLNDKFFPPGTHLMEKDVADSIEERLAAFARYNVRLMRPTADLVSLGQLPGNR